MLICVYAERIEQLEADLSEARQKLAAAEDSASQAYAEASRMEQGAKDAEAAAQKLMVKAEGDTRRCGVSPVGVEVGRPPCCVLAWACGCAVVRNC